MTAELVQRQNQTPIFRVCVRVKNNRLVRLREAAGYPTPAALARELDMAYSTILNLENFRESPINQKTITTTNIWRKPALKLAQFFDVEPAYIWPEEVAKLHSARMIQRELAVECATQMRREALEYQPPDQLVANKELLDKLNDALDCVVGKDKEVLLARYGGEYTLEEVAKQQGVSRERIRQRETTAIRKLRKHLGNNKEIAEALEAMP